MGEVEGILCVLFDDVDSVILVKAPRLRVVSKVGVGIDDIDIKGCNARKIPGRIGLLGRHWMLLILSPSHMIIRFFTCQIA